MTLELRIHVIQTRRYLLVLDVSPRCLYCRVVDHQSTMLNRGRDAVVTSQV